MADDATLAMPAKAGQDGFQQGQGMNDLPRPDREVPYRFKFLPARRIGHVPYSL